VALFILPVWLDRSSRRRRRPGANIPSASEARFLSRTKLNFDKTGFLGKLEEIAPAANEPANATSIPATIVAAIPPL